MELEIHCSKQSLDNIEGVMMGYIVLFDMSWWLKVKDIVNPWITWFV
jgi:hypothetical protein